MYTYISTNDILVLHYVYVSTTDTVVYLRLQHTSTFVFLCRCFSSSWVLSLPGWHVHMTHKCHVTYVGHVIVKKQGNKRYRYRFYFVG